MSTGELLSVEPQELTFHFELKKQISCSLQLSNNTDNYVAFKVKTTNPKKYCVRPNTGIVLPRSTCDVIVTMQAQRELPADMQCKDKFLLQSVIADSGTTPKDITPEMFNKESGNLVEECKLRVVYVAPPQPPSPVPEGSEEGSSPRGSIDNGNSTTADFTPFSRPNFEPQDKSPEHLDFLASFIETILDQTKCTYFMDLYFGSKPYYLKDLNYFWKENTNNSYNTLLLDDTPRKAVLNPVRALILKLTEEKSSAIQHANKLRQELDLLRRESSKSRGGVSVLYIVLFGLIGILLGYLIRKT